MEPLLALLTLDHGPALIAGTAYAVDLLLHTTFAFDQGTLTFLSLFGFVGLGAG